MNKLELILRICTSYFINIQKAFPQKKVSVKQAVKILRRNGIHVNEEKAEVILDFLYLIAKTYSDITVDDNRSKLEPKT